MLGVTITCVCLMNTLLLFVSGGVYGWFVGGVLYVRSLRSRSSFGV